jgi:hypothetical protein
MLINNSKASKVRMSSYDIDNSNEQDKKADNDDSYSKPDLTRHGTR